MAVMYPRQLKADAVQSSAEIKLFDVLAHHLDNQFSVFHSRALLSKDARNNVLEKEIDFLIAHPDYGILALEVKGGLIQINGVTGEWASIDRHNKFHPIKNPAEQAKSAIHALMNGHVRAKMPTRQYQYPFGYAVALPDTEVSHDLSPDLPRLLVLDHRSMRATADLRRRMVDTMKHWQGTRPKPGTKAIAALTQLVAPSHFLRTLISTDFEDESDQIKELTEDQYQVLDERLDSSPRYLITGCAGSGKTVLAIEKAQRLAAAGQKVLYVCYNQHLDHHLRKTVATTANLEVIRFHSLCRRLIEQAGGQIANYTEAMSAAGISSDDYYDGVLPNRAREAVEKLPLRYDAILVDEAQDFRRTYWPLLTALLRDREHSPLYLFADDSQRIYSHDALPFEKPGYHLKKNLRNIKPIGEVVGSYRRGTGDYVPAGPDSLRKMERIDLAQYPSKADALKDVLDSLMDERVPLEHIILLTPLNENSEWRDKMRVGEYTLVRGVQHPGGKHLCVESIQGFKGLERPVVILSELDRLPKYLSSDEERDNLLYVALSRARNHLIVLGMLPDPRPKAAGQ